MPTFLDESGDTGRKRHSKPYFRLGAAYLPSAAAANAFRAAVKQLRADLGLRADYEFRFAKTSRYDDRVGRFFDAALGHDFRFVVCSLDKTSAAWRTASKEDMHYATAMYLATTLRPVYRQAEAASGRRLAEPVWVDDCEDGKYLEIVRHAFRGLASGLDPGTPLVGRPEFGNSSADELLQLADMVCGAVGDHLDGRSGWYNHIRPAGLGVDCGWGSGVSNPG